MALFLFSCYTIAINVYNIKKKKIIESPKFRQTLRFYKFILNLLSNLRIMRFPSQRIFRTGNGLGGDE